MEDTLRVGVISSTHGVRGEVKVYPTTDDVNRFKKLKTVILDTGREQMTLSIESVKFFKNMVILKFKEFNNINDIEKYPVSYLARSAVDRHKTRHIAPLRRGLRNKLFGQVVVEIAFFQVGAYLFVYNYLFFRHRISVSP